jgi:hypothetical protein
MATDHNHPERQIMWKEVMRCTIKGLSLRTVRLHFVY